MTKDENGYLETLSFSWGIMHIFMAYVALIGRTVGEFRHHVDEAEAFNNTNERRMKAERAIWSGAFQGLCIMLLLIIIGAVVVPILTNPLDERMGLIIEGFSRLVAGCVQGLLSLRVAIWLDVYYWRIHRVHTIGTTIAELKHRIRWGVCKKILRMFFVLLFLFQGADAVTIPVSIIAGIAAGAAVDVVIFKLRRVDSSGCQRAGCIALVVFLGLVSILQLANGILFIAAVWDDSADDVGDTFWDVYAFLALLLIVPIVHVGIWQIGKRKRQRDVASGLMDKSDSNHPRNVLKRHRMVTSMFISARNSNADERPEDQPFATDSKPMGALAENEREASTANNTPTNGDAAVPTSAEPPADPDEEILNASSDVSDEENPPTLGQLLMDWKCCGCVRGEDKANSQKIGHAFMWFVYVLLCLACCFSIFNNIGATIQQEAARAKLSEVNRLIYSNMDLGPVCAFDNKGADSNITTFADKDAAHAAGFLVLHCGACGHCSDWHNLRLEYTTRDILAAEGRKCAQQSLFGGGYDSLVECLGEPAIGFQGQCAICWADDILCTKKFCWQIGLQSFLINTLTTFEVNNDTITAAACEEAHCEAKNPGDFVECSGATRRRMNVTSGISRPGAQQCSIVDVDWAELFPEEE